MLGPHVIGEPGSLAEFCVAAQPVVIKYLNPTEKAKLVFAPLTIGRLHPLSEQKDMSNPLALAAAHADEIARAADRTGIPLWEGINEPPVWNGAEYISRLCEYENERVRLLNARGLGAVVLNLSVGWPREVEGHIDWEPFAPLLAELHEPQLLGLHEYWYPGGPLGADSKLCRTGRLFRCPYNVSIVVGECGVDIGGGQNDGWRGQGLTAEQYAAQLAEYRDLIAADPRVKGATPFCYGNNGQWKKFDVEPDWPKFVDVFRTKPTPAQRIRVLRASGVIQIMDLEEYLRSVVPAEMPASWPLEALEAQAVAARSYALACIAKKRVDWDVTDDTRFQVYNPDMIHPRSDQAIAETQGVYLVRDGQPRLTEYKARCGRGDCPYCVNAPVKGGKSWPGQMCQYGARALVEQGRTWREILQHYYGEIEVRG